MSMNFDMINGLILLGGAFVSTLNIHQILKDGSVKGIHWFPTLYFVIWGYWNIIYFYSSSSFISTIGSVVLAIANTTWLLLILYYKFIRRL